jgi:hypothetical protein
VLENQAGKKNGMLTNRKKDRDDSEKPQERSEHGQYCEVIKTSPQLRRKSNGRCNIKPVAHKTAHDLMYFYEYVLLLASVLVTIKAK